MPNQYKYSSGSENKTSYANYVLTGFLVLGTSVFLGLPHFNTNIDNYKNEDVHNSFYISDLQDNSDEQKYEKITYTNITVNKEQGGTMSIELTENLSVLHDFLELEDNWDGEGAKQFNKAFIDFLSQIIMNLTIQPDIFPLQDGRVVFEFGNVRSKYLEFSIDSEKHMDIYKKDEEGQRFKDINVAFTESRFEQEVKWFEN